MDNIISQRETFKTIRGITYRYLNITYRDADGRRRKTSKSLGPVQQLELTPRGVKPLETAELTPRAAMRGHNDAIGDQVTELILCPGDVVRHKLAPGWLGRVVEVNGHHQVKAITLTANNDHFSMWRGPTNFLAKYLTVVVDSE